MSYFCCMEESQHKFSDKEQSTVLCFNVKICFCSHLAWLQPIQAALASGALRGTRSVSLQLKVWLQVSQTHITARLVSKLTARLLF